MPFPTRVISSRQQIDDYLPLHKQPNTLQTTNVSNLIGLLNQLNTISLHANAIFTDILNTVTKNDTRLQSVRKRISDLDSALPRVESQLIRCAPSYFYDNPYSGKEYLRHDALNGLLFSRDDSNNTVNERRDAAITKPDFTSMDQLSISTGNGHCIKQYSNPDFFINEWLENEKRKRKEQSQQRRKDRQNRKKARIKRKQTNKITKLVRKHYDKQGNVINVNHEPTEIAVEEKYELIDDILLSQKKAKKAKVETLEPPPFIPSFSESNSKAVKPPPFTPSFSDSKSSEDKVKLRPRLSKLRDLSAQIPMNDITYDIPSDAPSPMDIYAKHYQKRDLDHEKLDLSSASNIITTTPKEVELIAPKLNFLNEITAFKKHRKLKETEVNINRHRPKDKRTNLLSQLRNSNKIKLNSVKDRKIAAPLKEKRNLIFEAMADRRKHIEDSSDESEESDWGSQSE